MSKLPQRALQAFESAARHGSFALAADELFITASGISHQIKILEERLAIKLFHRVHRKVLLTDAGRRFAEQVSGAYAQIELAAQNLLATKKSDILTVHVAPSLGTQWLMPRLARFSARHPDIDVRINASSDWVDLTRTPVDIDIRYGRNRQRNLARPEEFILTLPKETLVPMCAPKLLPPNKAVLPADLLHLPLIHSENCLLTWGDFVEHHHLDKADLSRGLRFDRSFMAVHAAVDGLGVCHESLILAERELASGALVAPLGLQGLSVTGYTFSCLENRLELPKIRSFQEWLLTEMQGN
ncbi:MAG: hypothetical protein RLZZ502_72 [Pseudomonadota bacterium]